MTAARLAMLEAENAKLRERVALLERETLGAALVFPPAWELTALEQRVLAILLIRRQASKEQVMTALYRESARDEPGAKIVDVLVCNIRRKMRRFGLDVRTVWGIGYAIDEPLRSNFRRDLEEAR